MKVDINISKDVKEPYVVIHTDKISEEISKLAQDRTVDLLPGRFQGRLDPVAGRNACLRDISRRNDTDQHTHLAGLYEIQ